MRTGSGQVRVASPIVGRLSAGHVLMLVAGLIGAAATFSVLRAADDTVAVVVARNDLRSGARLTESDLGSGRVAADAALLGHFVRAADHSELIGQVLIVPARAGAPVLRQDVRAVAASDGRRAVSFAVPVERGVGGALDAGDRIDVIAVDRDGNVGYALVDAEVLDRAQADTGAPIRGGSGDLTLTVAVDAIGARRLAAAIHAGDVTVVRSTGADALGEVTWFTTDAPEQAA
jgi:Flp pilus assembly protein CpaB